MKRPKFGSKTYLEMRMKDWLWAAGYRECMYCHLWLPDVSRNKSCGECGRRTARERMARRNAARAGMPKPKAKANEAISAAAADDWGQRANAYFASQVDLGYYRDPVLVDHLRRLAS